MLFYCIFLCIVNDERLDVGVLQGMMKKIGKGKKYRKGTYDRMLALAAHALAEVLLHLSSNFILEI